MIEITIQYDEGQYIATWKSSLFDDKIVQNTLNDTLDELKCWLDTIAAHRELSA